VAEADPATRGHRLNVECADDDELRAEVESLLQAYDQSQPLFEMPPLLSTEAATSREPPPSLENL
jgi:hypothetical protein